MSNTWIKLILICAVFLLSAGAVNIDDSCEANLVVGRYYGAFYALLKSRKLKAADLEAAVASVQPYNPFRTASPRLELMHASRLFAKLTEDSETAAHWLEIRSRLSALLDEEQRRSAIQAEARVHTARILSPAKINSFPYEDRQELAWTTLPDGRVALAGVRRGKGAFKELFVITPEGDEVFHTDLPKPAPDSAVLRLGWHRDAAEKLWLYFTAIATDGAQLPRSTMYRLDWDTKLICEVKLERSAYWSADYFRSVGGYMIAALQDRTYYDVTNGDARRLNLPVFEHPQAAAADAKGTLYTRFASGSRDGGRSVVLTTREGVAYRVGSHRTEIEIFLKDQAQPLKTIESGIFTHQLLLTETASGRILLAEIGHDRWSSQLHLLIYAPLEAGQKPVYAETIPGTAGIPYLHWFKGLNGEALLGFVTEEEVHFVDPELKARAAFGREPGFIDWFSSGPQTYFYIHWQGQVGIYTVLSETKR